MTNDERCDCGEPVHTAGERFCVECQREYDWQAAHYGALYRAGALTPPGPWKSRDQLIREAGQRDDGR
jgi:hypothetical protein